MKRQRHQIQQEEDNGSEVQTVYGDVVTFIMSLFILLFVITYNEFHDKKFLHEMRIELGGKIIEQSERLTSDAIFVSKIEGYIRQEKLENVTKVLVDEQKIKIILQDPILYQSGKADLSARGKEIISGFADVFKMTENPIIVEGHTDSVPIHTAQFGSNWELSFFRAFSVVQYLIGHFNFTPNQLSCLGYGEYRPVAPNDTPANRALNRRIEINIIRVTQAGTETSVREEAATPSDATAVPDAVDATLSK